MLVLSVVGARPQFVKASAVSRVLRRRGREVLLHTGQHYDPQMSAVFFEELSVPAPERVLSVGSGTHAEQTAASLKGIESACLQVRPDLVLVYGDTNATVAGALAAAKLKIPVAHVEAGLRSFDRAMPEEINRVVTDHLASLLFAPTPTAVGNLRAEGISTGVVQTGDVMYDVFLRARDRLAGKAWRRSRLGLPSAGYALLTMHRARTADDPTRVATILRALGDVPFPVVFPVHPRTRRAMPATAPPPNLVVTEPLGYLDMIDLLLHARVVVTDSGGVQKEAYFAAVPCVTLRATTEWTETVDAGWNHLVDADPDQVHDAVVTAQPPPERPELYGDGHAAERIVDGLVAFTPGAGGPSPAFDGAVLCATG